MGAPFSAWGPLTLDCAPFACAVQGIAFSGQELGRLRARAISMFEGQRIGCMEAIDLTQDDDNIIYIRPAKRARPSGDSDVELVENPDPSQVTSKGPDEERHLGASEDLVITREIGQVRSLSPLFWSLHLIRTAP